MQPHQPKKAAAGTSRAKMLMRRDLAWMAGFPGDDGQWIVVARGQSQQSLCVDRTTLRRATFTLNKLQREFPRALPKIVGHVDRWASLHRQLLAAFKAHVHHGAALATSALTIHEGFRNNAQAVAKALSAKDSSLAQLVDAFAWRCWLAPQDLNRALRWLENHQGALIAVVALSGRVEGCATAIRLWELSCAHGPARVLPLLAWYAASDRWQVPTEQGHSYAHDLQYALSINSKVPVPEVPSSQCKHQTRDWLHWLVVQEKRVARRALELFALVAESRQPEPWHDWWATVDQHRRRAEKIPPPPRRRHPTARKLNALRERIRVLGGDTPPVVPSQTLFSLLRAEALQPIQAQYRAVRQSLTALPVVDGKHAVRLNFLAHWNRLRGAAGSGRQGMLTQLIRSFGEYALKYAGSSLAMAPWERVWSNRLDVQKPSYDLYTVDSKLLWNLSRLTQIPVYFSALSVHLARSQDQDSMASPALTLVDIVAIEPTSESAARLLEKLCNVRPIVWNLPVWAVKWADEICDGRPKQMAAIAKALDQLAEHTYDDLSKTLAQLVHLWRDTPPASLSTAILNGHLRDLCDATLKTEVVRRADGRPARPRAVQPTAQAPDWVRAYPAALNSVLTSLVSADPQAKRTADRILGKDYPAPERLAAQIEALKARVVHDSNSKLMIRLSALEARLAEPSNVGAGRLANLERKLNEAVVRAVAEDWQRRVDVQFRRYLPRLLNIDAPPDWAEDSQTLGLLVPAGRLSVGFQRLLARILRRRAQAPPWDLRDAPKNRAFIEAMRARDVRMTPWLDDAPVLNKDFSGGTISVTLERDPLEVFSMGRHFKTCLSPGSINYYSVFANAADVNKQVLYARRADGSVVGRCLLALSDAGGIVTFHPYCHDRQLQFAKVVETYVGKLAAAMHTKAMARGRISTLVAPKWYDDGPVDITGQFALLESRAFLTRLEEAELSEVQGLLLEAIAPLPINELTLPVLLSHPAFAKRPELMEVVYPYVLHKRRLEPAATLQAVELLNQTGRYDAAARLAPRLLRYALALHRDQYSPMPVIEQLAHCAPSLALRLLKQTRARAVRRWQQETDTQRLYAGAVANHQLRRPAQARRLLRAAMDAEPGAALSRRCEALLQRIDQA